MGGLSRITRGIIQRLGDIISTVYNVTRVYCPLTISIANKKQTITVRPITKKINLKIQCPEE